MHTVTGPHYEFQAAGEYVLLRSPDGSLEVQGRQEPMPGSAVTINTAAAVNLGAHRASVYFDSASQALVVHVDGQPVTLSAPMAVGGGTLRPVSSGVEIDAADGTRVWLLGFPSHPKYGINIQVLPSAALRGKASGVLGDVPLGYITPLLPDGTGRRVSADPIADYTFTYQTFAPAWRVTDTDTLFDYAAGQNTESFTVPGFVPLGGPPKPVPFGGTFGLDPSARAASETACAGVANVELRNDCVFDVTASGDSGFVQSYANTATFLATQTGAPPAAAPAPSGGPTIKPLLTGFSGVYGAAVGPDGALDVVVTLPSGPAILAVDPATTTIRTQQSLNAPSAASLAVAAGSLWVVVGAQTPAGCAVDRVDPASLTVTGHLTPPACPEIGSHNLAGAGDQLWMLGSGSPKDQLQRIDTSSLTVAQTIPVTANLIGALYASATSVFCTGESEVDRIDAASGSLVKLDDGTDSTTFAGDGIWEEPDVGDLAFIDSYHTIAKHLSIPTQGEKLLVGADEQNVYLEEEDNKAVLQLPIDGSQGMSLGTSDQLGGTGESAFIVGSRNIFRVYGAPASQGGAFSLFVENFPLP
ncbi:MAG: hypothetical protein JOZ75_14780 [Candidatus Dormibacteraeota bacterium]|nr:hypothetical protein [Candidatus Dormibacteraeota bacterium]